MSFNKIQLPNVVLVDLYKNALVEMVDNKQNQHNNEVADQAASSGPREYLGKNLKNHLIFVNYPQEKFLPEEQLNFLTTILKACNLSLEEMAIINTAHRTENLTYFVKTLSPKTILFFGTPSMSATDVGPLTDFYITDMAGVSMVSSPPLENLNQNNNESKLVKRKLWECLKLLFNV